MVKECGLLLLHILVALFFLHLQCSACLFKQLLPVISHPLPWSYSAWLWCTCSPPAHTTLFLPLIQKDLQYLNNNRHQKRWRILFWNLLPSIRVVLNCLRIDFAAPHILYCQGQSLSVFDFGISHSFQVSLLDLWMLSPNDFSICIHGHGRFFTTKLENNNLADEYTVDVQVEV